MYYSCWSRLHLIAAYRKHILDTFLCSTLFSRIRTTSRRPKHIFTNIWFPLTYSYLNFTIFNRWWSSQAFVFLVLQCWTRWNGNLAILWMNMQRFRLQLFNCNTTWPTSKGIYSEKSCLGSQSLFLQSHLVDNSNKTGNLFFPSSSSSPKF